MAFSVSMSKERELQNYIQPQRSHERMKISVTTQSYSKHMSVSKRGQRAVSSDGQ